MQRNVSPPSLKATKPYTIHCHDCNMSSLCLPFSLNAHELTQLDEIISRKKPVAKGTVIMSADTPLTSLFAIRSGSLKSYTITTQGREQITGFHFAGDVIGFAGIEIQTHTEFAQTLDTTMICEIPFTTLDTLSGAMPKLRQHIMRLMSRDIQIDHAMMQLLSKKSAAARLATFMGHLSQRFKIRGLSATELRLSMTRCDMANYLGLTVETISRLLGRFQQSGFILVAGKAITIVDPLALAMLANEA